MAAAAGRRRTTAAVSPTSLDDPASGPRQTKRQSPTGVSPPPITTEASSKRPTTDSKDHDRRLTIISRYAGYFEVAPGHEAPRWVGWTGLDGCKAVTGLPTFSTRIVIYLILIRRAGASS